MNGPPEVGDLQISFHVEEKVLWLDVSVDDVLRVTIRQSLGHLPYELARHGFVELSTRSLLEEFVHLASGGKLQDEVDFGLIVEVAEEPQNVDMSGGKIKF